MRWVHPSISYGDNAAAAVIHRTLYLGRLPWRDDDRLGAGGVSAFDGRR
jgi:hypothetical protein